MTQPLRNYSFPSKAKQQIEVGTFWRASRMVRLAQQSPAGVDTALNSLLSNYTISDWLRDRLTELVELNKKRFPV